MASFTDNTQALSTFNPYVQELPVDAMVKVGMAKQQKYEEGVQKIQTAIDNIAGLEIYKDSDKAYLQSKINELGNNLKVFAAGDFSDFQLVNSVNGMTTQLVKDPNVQNAVSATAKAKKELAFMDEQIKAGKSSPANEAVFKKKFASWADNTEIGQGFNAKYDPYFDVFKYTKETFDALKPDGYSFDQIYVTDDSGNPIHDKNGQLVPSKIMKRLEKEGMFPEKVKETLNQIFSDPRVSKQLSIDGQYNFGGMDEEALKQKVQLKKESDVSKYEDALFALRMEQSMGGKDVSGQIDTLEDKITKINESYNSLLESKDLDNLRGSLYRQDTYDRYTNMFTNIKTKEQILDNPLFKINFELNKEANRRQEAIAEHELNVRKFEREEFWKRKNYDLDVFKAQTEANKKGGPGKGNKAAVDGGTGQGTEGPYETERNYMLLADGKYTSAANNYSTAQDMFIWNTIFANKVNPQVIQDIANSAPGDTPLSTKQAISVFLRQKAKQMKMNIGDFRATYSSKAREIYDKTPDKTKITTQSYDLFQDMQKAKFQYTDELNKKKTRDKYAAEIINSTGLSKEFSGLKPETVTYRGQNITLTPANQIDIATYIAGKHQIISVPYFGSDISRESANQAKRRLDKAGLGDIAERYLQSGRALNAPYNPISGYVGAFASAGSALVDLVSPGKTNVNSDGRALKMFSLATAIANKSYNKVMDSQAKIIRGQYNINPNRAFTLTSGDAESDRALQARLSTYSLKFSEGDKNQNLATADQFEKFQASLNDKDARYTMSSTTDENGNPVWAVESDSKDGRGKMVLNNDQAMQEGFVAKDIFESDNVLLLRSKINQYNGKTCVQDPADVSTYKNNEDYFYDNSAGNFPNVRNKNYTVRANVAEYNGKYYPYIYVSDGQREKVDTKLAVDNLETLDNAMKQLTDAQVQLILNSK